MARAVSPPDNDDFENPTLLTGASGQATGNSRHATAQPGEPSLGGGVESGASVWFRWTAPVSGFLKVDTSGSAFDTLLAAYTGSALGALVEVAFNDDAPSSITSRIQFPVDEGATYHVLLDGLGTEGSGAYVLNYSLTDGSSEIVVDLHELRLDAHHGGGFDTAFTVSNDGVEDLVFETSSPADWLDVFPASGIVGGGETATVSVFIRELPSFEGSLDSRIVLTSNAANGAFMVVPVVLTREGVAFEDARLRNAVAERIGLRTGWSVSVAQLAELEELDLSSTGITGIGGLEHAMALRVLNLNDNYITNVDPVTGLAEIEELYLRNNFIRRIDRLSTLGGLRELDVSGNLLDLAEGTSSTRLINEWIGAGVSVAFEPQRPPRPPNDDFADAVDIGGPGNRIRGTTMSATAQASEPDHDGTGTWPGSVWYRLRPAVDGIFEVRFAFSTGDATAVLYRGDTLATLARAGRHLSASPSPTAFGLEAGQDYFLAVDGYSDEWVDFALDFSFVPAHSPGGPVIEGPLQLWGFDNDEEGWVVPPDSADAIELGWVANGTGGFTGGNLASTDGVSGRGAYRYHRTPAYAPGPGGALFAELTDVPPAGRIAMIEVDRGDPRYAALIAAWMQSRSGGPEIGLRFDLTLPPGSWAAGGPGPGHEPPLLTLAAGFAPGNEWDQASLEINSVSGPEFFATALDTVVPEVGTHFTGVYPLSAFEILESDHERLTFFIGLAPESSQSRAVQQLVFDNFRLVPMDLHPADELSGSSPELHFQDENLRAAVFAALGLPPGVVLRERDLAGLFVLDLSGAHIGDVAGLGLATDLRELDLTENELLEVSALSALTGLEVLRLAGNFITDLSPLLALTELRLLDVSRNQLDLAPDSPASQILETLAARGVLIESDPQRPPPATPSVRVQLRSGIGRWRLHGETEWRGSGATVSDLDAGTSCTIEFEPIDGWWRPVPREVVPAAEALTVVEAAYVSTPAPSSDLAVIDVFHAGEEVSFLVHGASVGAGIAVGSLGNNPPVAAVARSETGILTLPFQGVPDEGAFLTPMVRAVDVVGNRLVGESLDARSNLTPVVWSRDVPDRFTEHALPVAVDPSAFNAAILGRASVINASGTTIVGQVLAGDGSLQAAIWRLSDGVWEAPVLVGYPGSIGLLPASHLTGVSSDGELAVGFVEEFGPSGRVRFAIAGSVGNGFMRLPVPVESSGSSASGVSGAGDAIVGMIQYPELPAGGVVALWNRVDDAWELRTWECPEGFESLQVRGFADPVASAVSVILKDVATGTGTGALLLPAEDRWIFVAEFLMDEWQVDFGDWVPAIVSFDRSSGRVVGDLHLSGSRSIGFYLTPQPSVQILESADAPLKPGNVSRIPVYYRTSGQSAGSEGLVLRVHYDSHVFQSVRVDDVVSYGAVDIQVAEIPVPDDGDLDEDPKTDRYVEVRWFGDGSSWPSVSGSIRLLDLVLTPHADWPHGETSTVRFSVGHIPGFVAETLDPVFTSVPGHLDIDGDGRVQAFSDGFLLARYLLGFDDSALVRCAVGPGAIRTSASSIRHYVEANRPFFDIDGDGSVEAETDAVLIIRHLLDFNDEALLDGAVSPEAAYIDPASIRSRIEQLIPHETND